MSAVEVLVALAILVGLAGIVVPILPGVVLIVVALGVWALAEGSAAGWGVFAIAVTVIALGQYLKYAIPGQQLKASGVPNRSLVAGGLLGIVGFFVVPVVGLFVGFVLGIYASEYQRIGGRAAWPSTRAALRAVGWSILIELAAALVATAVWIAGVIAT